MKLTPEQQKLVEENHNLIYGYLRDRHLDHDEWYDLLAIELCYAVMYLNPEKSILSTYFYLRADSRVGKVYRDGNRKKRKSNGNVSYNDALHNEVLMDEMAEELEIREWIEAEGNEILKLKYSGLNQTQIAHQLGISQARVSNVLKEFRKEYREKYEKSIDR